jgi:competence protein ComEC
LRSSWHIPAIAAVFAVLTKVFYLYWFIVVFFGWLCFLLYKYRLEKLPAALSLVSFIFFLFYLPSSDVEQSPRMISTDKNEGEMIIGEIITPVSMTSQKIELTLKEQGSGEQILLIHFLNDDGISIDTEMLKHGAVCTVQGERQIPPHSRNPGQFDYQNYLLKSGITYQIIIDSPEQINCMGESSLQKIYELRSYLLSRVKNFLSSESAAWLNALVLGYDDDIDDETIQLFQHWSLSHLLAISGLHVGIVVTIFYFILVKLGLVTKEKAQLILMCFLPVFSLLSGGEPSVNRATAMVFLVLFLNKLKIKLGTIDVLSIVFLVVLLADRFIVYHVGFQFSFIVTLGLLLSKDIILEEKSVLMQGLKISFISQMMIIPLQVNYFATFMPLSILLNTIIVPYFSIFVIPLMFFLLLLTLLFPPALTFFDQAFIYIHSHILQLIEWVDQYLYLPWTIGTFPLAFTLMYYILLFLFMLYLENRQMRKAFLCGVAITAVMIAVCLKPYVSPYGTVTMLDIGQGDAFVIELPYRKGVIMIDAGASLSLDEKEPSERNYQQVIKPYLQSRGIDQIEALILTHEDIDHMGSMSFIVDELKVERVVISEYFELPRDIAQLLQEKNVLLEVVTREEELQVGGQPFYVLGPGRDYHSSNDNSLILYTKIGGKYWLFTGDISREQERDLMTTYPKLTTDVLKVAHHGSKTSSDKKFITQMNPEYGLIPVGENNRYGHPSKEVVELLDENHVMILRSDQHGAVQFRYKDEEGTFYRFLP